MEGNLQVTGAQLLILLSSMIAALLGLAKLYAGDKDRQLVAKDKEIESVLKECAKRDEVWKDEVEFWRTETKTIQAVQSKNLDTIVVGITTIRDVLERLDQRRERE